MSTTFVSASTGWVLGTAPCSASPCTSIVRTLDGGRTWRGIPAPRATLGQPYGGHDGDVSTLRFADPSDGWAGVDRLYSTHNGGATWTQQRIGPATGAVSDIETGGGYVFASVSGCPSQGSGSCTQTTRVYASPIGRDQWQAVSAILAGGAIPGALVVHGADWYLPMRAGVYHGHGLSAPTRLPNPCPNEHGSRGSAAIAVADANHLDGLCLGDGAAGSASYQLYGTTDGGRHWRRTGGAHREPSGLFGIADNAHGVLLAAVASGASHLLRTTDDGTSFHNASVAAPSGGIEWTDLGFTTASQAVAVLADTAMYLSHDSGATFAKVRF